MMNILITPFNDYAIVHLEGRLDTSNAGEFEKQLLTVIEEGSARIIIDCTGLDYISSSGLRVFLIVLKKIKVLKGVFSLCSLKPGIKEIFDISGFSTIFSVFPDKEAALKN